MSRRIRLLTVACVALVAAAVVVAAAMARGLGGNAYVRTVGGTVVKPNRFIKDTLRFFPGTQVVSPNARARWRDADRESDEPHTITVVRRRELPRTARAVEACFEGGPCTLAGGHLNDPQNPEAGIKTTRLDVGKPGFDTRGDSLFLENKASISTQITAPRGRNLYYLCAVHPWMQGVVKVR